MASGHFFQRNPNLEMYNHRNEFYMFYFMKSFGIAST